MHTSLECVSWVKCKTQLEKRQRVPKNAYKCFYKKTKVTQENIYIYKLQIGHLFYVHIFSTYAQIKEMAIGICP